MGDYNITDAIIESLHHERDALRAEVEVLRRAVDILAGKWSYFCDCDGCMVSRVFRNCKVDTCAGSIAEWTISEARKGNGDKQDSNRVDLS